MTQPEFDRFKADIMLKVGGAINHKIKDPLSEIQHIIYLVGYIGESQELDDKIEALKAKIYAIVNLNKFDLLESKVKKCGEYVSVGD